MARAGLLDLLDTCGLTFVLIEPVRTEAVEQGMAHGHVDATAIESRIGSWRVEPVPLYATVDETVLRAASTAGVLISNDLALGRRARNLGTSWLRTADLIVLSMTAGRMTREMARSAVISLRDAGRATPMLATSYLEELS